MLHRRIAGRYRPVDERPGGGYGTVYRAWDDEEKRYVAIKLIHREAESVFAEYSLMRTQVKRHPNIVEYIDVGRDPKLGPYVTMEYIEGPELLDFPYSFRAGAGTAVPEDFDELLRHLAQILHALEHLHRCGILHGDIKPSNVLVSVQPPHEDLIKLVDFGLAAAVLTAQRSVRGTPDFIAPEVLAAELRELPKIDHRADLYSVGVLAYLVITSIYPRGEPSPSLSMRKLVDWHKASRPEPIEAFRQDVPRALSSLVMRLLSKSPKNRPSSAFDAWDELRKQFTSLESAGMAIRDHDHGYPFADPHGIEHAILSLHQRGHSGVVLVEGDHLHGKSRLLTELGAKCAKRAEVVHCAYPEPTALEASPFRGDHAHSPFQRIAKRIEAKYPDDIKRLREVYPLILGEAPSEDGSTLEQREDQLSALLEATLLKDSPLTVLVDDVQWADPLFPSFVRTCLRLSLQRGSRHDLLIVLTLSPDSDPRSVAAVRHLFGDGGCVTFKIEEFNRAQIRSFLETLGDWEGNGADVLAAVLEEDEGGIPGFMDLRLRELERNGIITGTPTHRRVISHQLADARAAGPGVADRLLRRMQELPIETTSTLQTVAAFAPRAVSVTEISEVSQLDVGVVQERVGQLVDSGYLREVDRLYRFRTSSHRRVVYESIEPEPHRRRVHKRIAQLLEERYGENVDDRLPEVARHYLRSSDEEAGRRMSLRAARSLVARNQPASAIEFFAAAFDAHERLLKSSTDDALDVAGVVIDICIESAMAAMAAMEPEEAERLGKLRLARATELAATFGDRIRSARIVAAAAEMIVMTWGQLRGEAPAEQETLRAQLEDALRSIADEDEERSSRVRESLLRQLAAVLRRQRRYEDAIPVLESCVALAQEQGRPDNRLLSQIAHARVMLRQREAVIAAERAVDAAKRANDQIGLANAHRVLGDALVAVEERLDAAGYQYDKAVALAEGIAVGSGINGPIYHAVADFLSQTWASTRALELAEKVLADPTKRGTLSIRSHLVAARAAYQLCRYPAARRHLTEVVRYGEARRRDGQRDREPLSFQFHPLLYSGLIEIQLGKAEEGMAIIRDAITGTGILESGEPNAPGSVSEALLGIGSGLVRRGWVEYLSSGDARRYGVELRAICMESTAVYPTEDEPRDVMLCLSRVMSGELEAWRDAMAVLHAVATRPFPWVTAPVALHAAMAAIMANRPAEAEEAVQIGRENLKSVEMVDARIGIELMAYIAIVRQGRPRPVALRYRAKVAELISDLLPHLEDDAQAFTFDPFRRLTLEVRS